MLGAVAWGHTDAAPPAAHLSPRPHAGRCTTLSCMRRRRPRGGRPRRCASPPCAAAPRAGFRQHAPPHTPTARLPRRRPSQVEFADVGCGFGGLTVGLAQAYPQQLVLGMELRDKVTGAWRSGARVRGCWCWCVGCWLRWVLGCDAGAGCAEAGAGERCCARRLLPHLRLPPSPSLPPPEYVKERILALRKQQPGQYQNCSVVRGGAAPAPAREGRLEPCRPAALPPCRPAALSHV